MNIFVFLIDGRIIATTNWTTHNMGNGMHIITGMLLWDEYGNVANYEVSNIIINNHSTESPDPTWASRVEFYAHELPEDHPDDELEPDYDEDRTWEHLQAAHDAWMSEDYEHSYERN